MIYETGKIKSLKQVMTQKNIYSPRENDKLINQRTVDNFFIGLENLCKIKYKEKVKVIKGLENFQKVDEKNKGQILRQKCEFEKFKTILPELKSKFEFIISI
jgi:hypothetical protein